MYKLLATLTAVSAEEILQAGKTVGTASNQVILGALVVALALLVAYREWQQTRANKRAEHRHDEMVIKHNTRHEDLITRLDKERSAWEDERRSRISMLMTIVQDNTKAMERAAMAQSAVAEAVGINSSAITALRDLIYEMKIQQTTRRA